MQLRPLFLSLALAACGAAGSDAPPDPDLGGQDPELQRAVQDARAQVLSAPRDAVAWSELAMVLDANDLDAPAEEAWTRVTALAAGDGRGWYHLARVRERRGDPEGALAALDQALQRADDYAPAHGRRGRLLLESGRLEEAERSLRRSLELDAASSGAWTGLARLHLLRDEPAQAIALLEPLLARLPSEPYLNGLLARAHAMLGDSARAEAYLQAEQRAGPPSGRDPWQAEVQRRACGLRVRLERARARLAQGDAEGAWKELAPLAARADEPVVLDAQCQVLLALGKPEEVLARLSAAKAEQSSFLALNRVLALRALGDAPAALAEIEAELRRNPAHPSGHALAGELLFELERHAEAVQAFRAARARGDRSLASALFLARALAGSGDRPGGLAELEAAAQAFPAAPKPWAYRSELLALDGRDADARASLEEARRRGLEPALVAVVTARLDELAAAEGGR